MAALHVQGDGIELQYKYDVTPKDYWTEFPSHEGFAAVRLQRLDNKLMLSGRYFTGGRKTVQHSGSLGLTLCVRSEVSFLAYRRKQEEYDALQVSAPNGTVAAGAN
jgi:hypothetical protein